MIAIGIAANLAMKARLVAAFVGQPIRRTAAVVLFAPAVGLGAGWLVLRGFS